MALCRTSARCQCVWVDRRASVIVASIVRTRVRSYSRYLSPATRAQKPALYGDASDHCHLEVRHVDPKYQIAPLGPCLGCDHGRMQRRKWFGAGAGNGRCSRRGGTTACAVHQSARCRYARQCACGKIARAESCSERKQVFRWQQKHGNGRRYDEYRKRVHRWHGKSGYGRRRNVEHQRWHQYDALMRSCAVGMAA